MEKENQLTINQLPNLHEAQTSPRELSSEYWTPDEDNEYRVGVILEIKEETYANTETGEEVPLPCVIILSQNKDLTFNTIRNGSKRLVATIENAINSGEVEIAKTPVRITYLGKEKNKTNSYKSDKWSVRSLTI